MKSIEVRALDYDERCQSRLRGFEQRQETINVSVCQIGTYRHLDFLADNFPFLSQQSYLFPTQASELICSVMNVLLTMRALMMGSDSFMDVVNE